MADIATRRERVVLELEDNFTSGMARAAAASAVLNRELNSLSGQSVNSRSIDSVSKDMDKVGKSADRAGPAIDRFSGRLSLIRDVALTIGPAFVPIGAVAVPAITGLAAQLGAAAIAGGAMIAAFQGMGGALTAVNKAALEPTSENLHAAALAMQALSPQAQKLVGQLQEFRPALLDLRDAAGAGLFPGVGKALADLEGALPAVERLLLGVGTAAGTLAKEFGEGISGERGQEFIDFLALEAPRALLDLGRTMGNFTGGLAELWMAFSPLNNDFSDWLLDASESFDQWAQGLSQTQGFTDFVNYIRETGPKVADAMGAIGNAMLQIVEAAAPLGGPILDALGAVADVVAAIAGSDAGPAIMATATALTVLSRASKGLEATKTSQWFTNTKSSLSGMTSALDTTTRSQERATTSVAAYADAEKKRAAAIRGGLGTLGRGAALAGGLALATSGAAEGIGLQNTASLALMGTMGGPWGAAIGGAVGLVMDLASSNAEAAAEVERLAATYDRQTGAITENTRAEAVNKAQKAGLLDDAAALGIEESLVTDAILGRASAQRELNAALAGYEIDNTITSAEDLAGSYSKTEIAAILANRAATDLKHGLPGLQGEFKGAKGEAEQFAAGMGHTADETNRAKSAAQEFTEALTDLNELLSDRSSLRDYEASLDDAAKLLKGIDPSKVLKDGKIDITIPKGREVQETLDAIADRVGKVSERMKGAERDRYLTRARQDMIDVANLLFEDRKRAAEFVDYLLKLDGMSANPNVTADVSDAMRAIGQVQYKLQQLRAEPPVTLSVNTVYTESGRRFKDVPSGVAANGATVPKTGLGYADRHLYMLADGEEVISNRHGQADRFRRALKAINAGASSDVIRAFLANGGTAGAYQGRQSRPSSSVTHVTSAAPNVSVGGAAVRVFIDGAEVRAVVRSEQASDNRFSRILEDR